MAYTIEEIEKALVTARPEWPMYYPQNANRKSSVNYPIIINYLTGQSTSLNGLQQDDQIFFWNTLINLLHSIENISPEEQLVLDVLYEPIIFRNVGNALNHWLLLYAINNKNDRSFQAVMQQFRKQGLSDTDVFNYCVISMAGFDSTKGIEAVQTGLLKFLLDYVGQMTKLVQPAPMHAFSYWGNDWNLFYFKLLEEAKPAFAKEYALESIYSARNLPVMFFSTYKQGKYLPDIIASLTDRQNFNVQTIQSKFAAAIKFYETDQDKYVELVLALSHQYLDHISIHVPKQSWEQGLHLEEFKETPLTNLPFSSCAFHFLFKNNKNAALLKLNEWLEQKIFVAFGTVQVLHHHLSEAAFPYIDAILKAAAATGGIDYYRSVIDLLKKNFDPAMYLPLLWSLASNKSKPLRQLVAGIIAEKDAAAEKSAIILSQNKNSEARQTAAVILSYFNSTHSKGAIMKVLNTETNDNARDILLQTVADNLPTAASTGFIEDMVQAAKSRGKLNKPVDAALDESMLPALFYTTGRALSTDETRFLLYRMSRIKEMRSDMEARYILQFLDKEKSSEFALAIIKVFIDKGAKPEHKWLMALAALLGDDAVVDKIRTTINKWLEENRSKMAEHGVGALALHGSDKALRWVEWYSRKYRSKKANVGAAALAALEIAAEELGITTHELGDRIVPDFDFDGLFKHFTVNGEEFRAFIDSNFKIAFFNEDNKKLKAIPSAADAAVKEEFKSIAKEVRDIVRSQSSRLEYYLIIQRRWNFLNWQKFFLQNPVMFIYATKLLWGVYNEQEELVSTFLCNEDTSLLDINNEEIALDEKAIIGIVHPSQLNNEELKQWQQQFFDLKIDPVFLQLNRSTPELQSLDLDKAIITKYNGKQTKEGSIRSTLEKYGWHKGPAGDGGMLESFNLLYFEKKLEAVLEVEGVGAGYGWGMQEKFGRLFIIDKTKVPQKWFSHPANDEDERLIKLRDVPVIFLSEVLAAVESIKANESPV